MCSRSDWVVLCALAQGATRWGVWRHAAAAGGELAPWGRGAWVVSGVRGRVLGLAPEPL